MVDAPNRDGFAAYASCVPGLAPLLLEECVGLGLTAPHVLRDGVAFVASAADVARANRGLALASRVLLRVDRFRCLRLAELRRKAGNLDWAQWLDLQRPQAVRARCVKSKLYHSGAVAERVVEALRESGGQIDPEAEPTVDVLVDRDQVRIALDTSGAPLHQRGWRLETAKAPLREDLAAACVRVAAPVAGEVVVDPCAGAGTLIIEAATALAGLAPGRGRAFAFETAPWFVADPASAAAHGIASDDAMGCERLAALYGSDRDAGAVLAARQNAARAGIEAAGVEWDVAALRAAPGWAAARAADRPAVLLCNPPYGKRIGNKSQLRDLYAALGQEIMALPAGSRAVVISAEPELVRALRVPHLEPIVAASHGGLRFVIHRASIVGS